VIETITALVALMTAVQAAMVNPDFAWSPGHSWAFTVKSTITDAQLQAAKAPCCTFLTTANGTVLRVGGIVFLLKQP